MGPERGRGIIKHSCCSWKERQAVGIHTVLAPALSLWQRAILVEAQPGLLWRGQLRQLKKGTLSLLTWNHHSFCAVREKFTSLVFLLYSHTAITLTTLLTSDAWVFFPHTKQLSVTPARGSTIQFHLMLTCESHRPHRLKTQSHEIASRFKCQFKD